jgi:Ala-tRNA(Pro) deacylase
MDETGLYQFLEKHEISYQRVEHPAVFTCAEAEIHRPTLAAVSTKNLFLCDKKARRFFLLTTACEKNMDFSTLAQQLDVPKLRFGSETNLERLLGVTRGSVTLLGLANDTGHQVELWIDAEIWKQETFLCHPLVNTATLILSKASLIRFFDITAHGVHLFGG